MTSTAGCSRSTREVGRLDVEHACPSHQQQARTRGPRVLPERPPSYGRHGRRAPSPDAAHEHPTHRSPRRDRRRPASLNAVPASGAPYPPFALASMRISTHDSPKTRLNRKVSLTLPLPNANGHRRETVGRGIYCSPCPTRTATGKRGPPAGQCARRGESRDLCWFLLSGPVFSVNGGA